jgi:hypothetical protein
MSGLRQAVPARALPWRAAVLGESSPASSRYEHALLFSALLFSSRKQDKEGPGGWGLDGRPFGRYRRTSAYEPRLALAGTRDMPGRVFSSRDSVV